MRDAAEPRRSRDSLSEQGMTRAPARPLHYAKLMLPHFRNALRLSPSKPGIVKLAKSAAYCH